MKPIEKDPKRRFTIRVENYVKYRPGYPDGVLDILRGEADLRPSSVIADVGSGVGHLSRLFLDHGNRVFGVEPNEAMRAAGERRLSAYTTFTSVPGSAEATTLAPNSVDFITAGQAFHWFDLAGARREFGRILRDRGVVVLVWNSWGERKPGLNEDYRALVEKYGRDYQTVQHANSSGPEAIGRFFGDGRFAERHLENHQLLDFDGLRGRLLSSSYSPTPDHPGYEPMLSELRQIFDRFQKDGRVRLAYDTVLYFGRLSPAN